MIINNILTFGCSMRPCVFELSTKPLVICLCLFAFVYLPSI